MFVPHAVNPDERFSHFKFEISKRNVDLKLDVVLDRQMFAQILQILNALLIILVATTTDQDQANLPNNFNFFY